MAIAVALLHERLRAYTYHDVARQVRALPGSALALSATLTVLAYAALSGYDRIALAYVGRRLTGSQVTLGSFVSYAVSQTLGFPLLTGGSMRYRFWSAWGLAPLEIAKAIGFVSATYGLGMVFMGGVVLVAEPSSSAELLRVSPALTRAIGVACLALILAYLVLAFLRRGPVRVRGLELALPSPRIAVAQLCVAAFDWALAAAVLYVLLPSPRGVGFLAFVAAFLLAQTVGLVSHVPGGAGIVEAVLTLLLAHRVPATELLGAAIAYRVIYYLLPFAVAVVIVGTLEVRRRREQLAVLGTFAARWVPAVLPTVLAVTTFIGGTVLLASGATPSVRSRVSALAHVLPLGLIELSHFLGSLAGAGLIVLAWALQRRLDAAYVLTTGLLGMGVATSLLKGFDWEEALALGAVLAVLVASRKAFYRKAALTSEPLSPGWVAAVLIVVGVTTWLGVFSFKHVQYRDELWWRFTVHGDAPRFLRATVGVLGVLLVTSLGRLLRHAEAEPDVPDDATLERARAVAAASDSTNGLLALLADKSLLFSDDGRAFIMYGVEGRSWVALGDPVGDPAQRDELAWRFREMADGHGGWTIFYEASAECLPTYIDLGLTLLKIGEEARVPLADFSLEGGSRKGLRRVVRDAEKSGMVFEIADRDAVPSLLPAFRRVSDDWLAQKHAREKGFSLGRFDEGYLARFPAAVVRLGAGGEIVAFANVLATDGKEELSIDLMRHGAAAPKGVMDFLFVSLMTWGHDHGYQWFSLGMAPLSGFEERRNAPAWARAGAWLYRHGEHFYNFQGLRQYKAKFDPVWSPKYIASPGGLVLPRILTNVAALIGGGLRGVIAR